MCKKIMVVAFLLTVLFVNSVGHAQRQIANQQHSWYQYFGTHRITAQLGVHTEYQWRRTGYGQQWQQSLARVGLEYFTKAGPTLTAGYAYVETFPYGQQPVDIAFSEHRLWEQFMSNHEYGRLTLNHRFRLEQRWMEPNSKNAINGNDLTYRDRFRYRVMGSIALSRPQMEDHTLFAAFFNEFFIGYGRGIGFNVLDQNRLYTGLGWRFNRLVNLQAGYMNQYIIKPDGYRVERNHTAQVALVYNLDLRDQSN